MLLETRPRRGRHQRHPAHGVPDEHGLLAGRERGREHGFQVVGERVRGARRSRDCGRARAGRTRSPGDRRRGPVSAPPRRRSNRSSRARGRRRARPGYLPRVRAPPRATGRIRRRRRSVRARARAARTPRAPPASVDSRSRLHLLGALCAGVLGARLGRARLGCARFGCTRFGCTRFGCARLGGARHLVLSRSTRRVALRNSVVVRARWWCCGRSHQGAQLVQPPVFHTVRSIHFWTLSFQPSTAAGRASRAARPPRTSNCRT